MQSVNIPMTAGDADPRDRPFIERFGGFLAERGILAELAIKRA
jgi:hypothetical protein